MLRQPGPQNSRRCASSPFTPRKERSFAKRKTTVIDCLRTPYVEHLPIASVTAPFPVIFHRILVTAAANPYDRLLSKELRHASRCRRVCFSPADPPSGAL